MFSVTLKQLIYCILFFDFILTEEIGGPSSNKNKLLKLLKERFEGAANDDRAMFYCERCDYAGKSEAGLKVHTGKKHKGSPRKNRKQIQGKCL